MITLIKKNRHGITTIINNNNGNNKAIGITAMVGTLTMQSTVVAKNNRNDAQKQW